MKETFLASLGASVFWKGLERAAGLGKHLIIAASIGLSAQLDVFYMAIGILGLLVFSWANLMDVFGVPQLVDHHKHGRRAEFERLAASLFSLSLVISAILALIWWLGLGRLELLAMGFEPERREILGRALFWMLPIVVFYLPMRQLGAVFRSVRQFSVFYKSEFLISLIIMGIVAFCIQKPDVLYWSYSLGVFASFLYLLFKTGRDFRLLVNPFTPLVTKTLIASSALLLLQVVHHAFVFVDRAFISFLPKGAVGALAYAWVVVGLVPALLNPGGSFITVFAEHKDNPTRADGMVNEMLTMILLFGIPTSFFLAVFGTDIIALMLERGLFSQADTELTANGLMGFALAIVPLLLVNPLDQIFQVSNKLGLILRRSLVGLLANVVLNWIFLFMLGWGVLGVALATSLSYTVMVATGLLALPRIGIAIYWRIHMRWAGVLTIVSAVAVIVSNKAVGLLPSALRLPVGILLFSGLVALAATHGNAPGPILLKSVLSRIGRRGLRVFGKA